MKKIIIISGSVGSLITLAIVIIEFLLKIKILEKLFNLKIPDFVFLILILALLLWLIFISKKVKRPVKASEAYLKDKVKKIEEEINKIKEVSKPLKNIDLLRKKLGIDTTPPKEEEELEPDSKILYILSFLGNKLDRDEQRDIVWEAYKSEFTFVDKLDFNMVINLLEKHNKIRLDNRKRIEYLGITSDGLEYLRQFE